MKQLLLFTTVFLICTFNYAQNLVPNGNFESWEDVNTPSDFSTIQNVEQESVIVHSGNFSAKHTGGTKKIAVNVPIEAGKTYRISMWYYVDTEKGDGSDARIWSYWKSSSNNVDDNVDELRGPNNGFFESKAEWSQYEVELTAPATVDGLNFELRTYSGAVVYYDNLEVEETVSSAAIAPEFSHLDEYFSESFDLELTSKTEGASIYYTIDGSEPDETSMEYASPIFIDESTIVKAIAVASGYDNSNVVTQEFTKYIAKDGSFTRISSVDDLEEGKYLLGYNGNFMLNEAASAYIYRFIETNDVEATTIERPNQSVVWSLIKAGQNWLIYNETEMKYVSYTGDGNAAYLVDAANSSEEWVITEEDGVFIVKNADVERYLRYNPSSPRFSCYPSGQQALQLFKLDRSTNVESPSDYGVSVYPNPFSSQLTVSSNRTIASVELLNTVGQIVNKVIVTGDKVVMNTSSLSIGVYLLKVNYSNGSNSVKKVVKQ
ncbi:FN3 associated domain-containing protein [Saccharicrinis aurantiacus]|uniref:FN3 associated domain-containing protein n=1 Tax=Saccharicrinis aurantiacus TaxID=1849719 RepID=UPI00248FA9FD|nr:FN3 associated domain-containing protein [Saccharicrinis aurantiacus]